LPRGRLLAGNVCFRKRGMNKLFSIIIVSCFLLLTVFILLLVGGAVWELVRTGVDQPTDLREIFFAIKLSLYTASIASVLAILLAIPVAYGLSRYDFAGKHFLDTLLDLPIILSPVALGALLLVFFNTPVGDRGAGYPVVEGHL